MLEEGPASAGFSQFRSRFAWLWDIATTVPHGPTGNGNNPLKFALGFFLVKWFCPEKWGVFAASDFILRIRRHHQPVRLDVHPTCHFAIDIVSHLLPCQHWLLASCHGSKLDCEWGLDGIASQWIEWLIKWLLVRTSRKSRGLDRGIWGAEAFKMTEKVVVSLRRLSKLLGSILFRQTWHSSKFPLKSIKSFGCSLLSHVMSFFFVSPGFKVWLAWKMKFSCFPPLQRPGQPGAHSNW